MYKRRSSHRPSMVRKSPLIYGNLQKPTRDYSFFAVAFKRVAWLGSMIAIIWAIFWSNLFSIRSVEVQGNLLSDVQQITDSIPKGENIWLFPKQSIEAKIAASQPVVGVTILRGIPGSVRVVVTERQPVMLWQANNGVSLIDKNGEVLFTYPIETFPTSEKEPGITLNQLPRVQDGQNVPVTVGGNIATTQFVAFVSELQSVLATYLPEMRATKLEVKETTYDLELTNQDGLRVMFSTLGDPAPQVRNLKRLLTQESISPNAAIDLRIDRWAYVTQ